MKEPQESKEWSQLCWHKASWNIQSDQPKKCQGVAAVNWVLEVLPDSAPTNQSIEQILMHSLALGGGGKEENLMYLGSELLSITSDPQPMEKIIEFVKIKLHWNIEWSWMQRECNWNSI